MNSCLIQPCVDVKWTDVLTARLNETRLAEFFMPKLTIDYNFRLLEDLTWLASLNAVRFLVFLSWPGEFRDQFFRFRELSITLKIVWRLIFAASLDD
jgi:hypothetical protein